MAKLIKNINQNKFSTVNLKEIYNELKKEPHSLLVLMSAYYNLEFFQQGKRFICSTHSGIKIEPVKKDTQVYTVNNYSNALELKGGQIKAQLFNLTKGLTGVERVKKQVEILTKCNLIDNYYNTSSNIVQKLAHSSHSKPTSKQIEVNQKKSPKKPVFVDYNTPYGNKVFSHLNKKTGSSVQTLLKYNVFATTSKDEIRYSYQVGKTIKSKFPHREIKEGKFSVFNHSSTYVFGLNQLPKKGKVLILASGEDDALCINQNLNKYGIFSVCSWNETTCIPKTVANDLLSRFERCFVLGDNDNPQTTKKSYEIAKETGFIWIDTDNSRALLDIPMSFDVCDIYKGFDLKQFITFCIETNHQIQDYKDDPDSIKVDHCYKINCRKYIGQNEPNQFGIVPLNFIQNVLTEHNRVILDGLAGIGKSTLIGKIVSDFPVLFEGQQPYSKNLELLGIKHTIILEPTTAITDQLHGSFNEWKLKVGVIKGGTGKVQQADIENESVTIVTFDSLEKITPILEDSLLIIDEFHQLSIDLSYRDKEAFKLVEQLMFKAKKLLLMSATPTLIYTQSKELHKQFGFKLIKAIQSVKNKIEVTEIQYKGALKDVPLYIADNYAHEQGTILIKRDDKKTLNAAAKIIQERGLKQDVFYSKDRSRKEDNKNYQSIMKNGLTVDKLKALLFTSLLEAGVSLKFPVSFTCLLDVESWQKVIQLSSRARYNEITGVNSVNKVQIYRSVREKKSDSYNREPILKTFKKLLDVAQYHSDITNAQKKGKKEYKITELDENEINLIVMVNRDTGKTEPSILGINRLLYQKQIERPFSLFIKRIERYDDRVKIMPTQTIRTDKNEEMEAIRKQQKTDKKEANLNFINLLEQDFAMTAQVVYFLALDVDFKKRLQKTLGLMPTNPVEVQNFLAQAKGAFTGDEPKRIFNDICFFKSNTTLTLNDVIKKVKISDKKDIQAEKNQIKRHKRRKALRQENEATTEEQTLRASQKLQIGRINGICLTIDQYKKDFNQGKNRKEYLTKMDVHNLINRGIKKANRDCKKKFKDVNNNKFVQVFKPVNPTKANKILSSLYQVEEERIYINKKRVRVTKILSKIPVPKYIK